MTPEEMAARKQEEFNTRPLGTTTKSAESAPLTDMVTRSWKI